RRKRPERGCVHARDGQGRSHQERARRTAQSEKNGTDVRGERIAADVARAVTAGSAQILAAVGRGRERMERLKERAVQLARRAVKGAAALALHWSGARELLSTVQRRAVGGRRVLILSYHRVVKDFALEEKRSLASLNIAQDTFRRHLEVLQETHDIVPLDDALSVLDGSRAAARDVAVITFDDGYRDVYTHAFPVMCDMRVPAVVYVPSALIGTERRLGHDRLYAALAR